MQHVAAQTQHANRQDSIRDRTVAGHIKPVPADSDVMPDGAAQDCPGLLRAEVDRLRAEVASAHTKIENLEIALRSSRQIGAAVGVLMHQHRLTQNAAFDLLVAASQYSHRKLRDIAADVVYTGTSASVEAAARRNRSAVDLRGAIEVDHVRHLRHDD